MQAVLLATGETSKLRPLTQTVPSPMVPVAGRPVMAYPLELLIRQGFKHIFINLFASACTIEAYFGTGGRWGVELQYMLQSQALGSAGSLRWVRQHLTEPFIVLPGDQLLDIDLLPILEQHKARGSAATIVVHPGANPHFSGYNLTGEKIVQPGQDLWYETGAYIFDPRVLERIPARTAYDISADFIPALTSAGLAVDCFKVYGYWNTLETFSDYQEAQNALLTSAHDGPKGTPSIHYALMNGRKVKEGVWMGRNSIIHPQAQINPPVFIGDNCSIHRGAEIGPSAVLGNNVMVDEEATVANSTIMDGTYIGQLVNVNRRLVNQGLMIDLESGESVYITDEHLLSKTYSALEDSSLPRIFDVLTSLLGIALSLPISIPLGLLLLITTGRALTTSTYVHRIPVGPGESRPCKPRTYSLLQFHTQSPKGRYNWIGRWLERKDLHRLPQLWNVLKGDLRMVGVKPLTPEEDDRVQEVWQEKRYESQPGLTGLWFVQARPGGDLDEIFVADGYYTATRSWNGDIKLLFQTFSTWLRRLFQ
jgi:NDP-sugar pyrophosphorylase family protein